MPRYLTDRDSFRHSLSRIIFTNFATVVKFTAVKFVEMKFYDREEQLKTLRCKPVQ